MYRHTRWYRLLVVGILMMLCTASLHAQVDPGGTVTGQVRGADTQAGLANVAVRIYDSNGQEVNSTTTNGMGNYTFSGLAASSYRVGFAPDPTTGYLQSFYNGASSLATATPISVTAGQTTSQIDAELLVGGKISGTLTTADGGSELQNFSVAVFKNNAAYEYVTGAIVGPSGGGYTVVGLPTGSYRVQFLPATSAPSLYLPEFYDNVATLAAATPISVTVGQTTGGINAILGRRTDTQSNHMIYLPLAIR